MTKTLIAEELNNNNNNNSNKVTIQTKQHGGKQANKQTNKLDLIKKLVK